MNPITILISTTALIVVGALFFSLGSMRQNVASNPEEKELLRQELIKLQQMEAPSAQEVAVEPQTSDEVEAIKAELEALKAEQLLAQQRALAAESIQLEEPEIDPADEKRLQRRAKIISQALVMAQVQQYYPADGFVSISINNFDNVQEGVTLAVRRKSGILGQVRISTVENGEAIADVIPHTFIGEDVDIQTGDELIVPPL